MLARRDATVWVETDAACEVEVLGHRTGTFEIEGHHYALVMITDLEPGETYQYEVSLDGERVWPEEDHDFPPSVIRTISPDGELNLSYGSCRVSVPHEPPHTLAADANKHGYERDALQALALRMMGEPHERWPDALFLLGDQIYADEVSEGALEFIRSRRDTSEGPGEQVADFEEYTRLYWDAWREPVTRWLLSTVPSAMIFDDHDVNDDWNISETWVRQMRSTPWWEERIIGAFMSYWIYQHLGNLSPRELKEEGLFEKVREAKNPTRVLREFAYKADREIAGTRWSYHRDFGRVRLIVMDSRAGRVLEGRPPRHARRRGVGLDRREGHRRLRPSPLRHLAPLPPRPRPAPSRGRERGRLRREPGAARRRGSASLSARPSTWSTGRLPEILHRPHQVAALRRLG